MKPKKNQNKEDEVLNSALDMYRAIREINKYISKYVPNCRELEDIKVKLHEIHQKLSKMGSGNWSPNEKYNRIKEKNKYVCLDNQPRLYSQMVPRRIRASHVSRKEESSSSLASESGEGHSGS